MPGAVGKKKKNRGKTVLQPPKIKTEQNPPKKVSESPAVEIGKPTTVEKHDEMWFEPSVKGIDRGRPTPALAACNRAPVIRLYRVNYIMKLGDLLAEIVEKGNYLFSLRRDRTDLEINIPSKFVCVVKLLDELGVQYNYKNTTEDKCERYALRGIPVENEAEISKYLKEKGFYVHDVHRIIGTKSVVSAPVFSFCHTPLSEGPKLTDVKRVNKWMVIIEKFKGTKREPMFCFRCSRFAHSATFCTVNPRCFKCAGAHEGSLCAERQEFKCCNCDGLHPATSKCCPMYQRVKEYNTKARPKPPLSALGLVSPMSKLHVKDTKGTNASIRLQKLIAKSFVMVAWNAQGRDVENCPEFLKFLETQGAQLVCISGSHPLSKAKWNAMGWSVLSVTESMGVRGKKCVVGPTLLIRLSVAHSRLLPPSFKHMSAVVASVETKSGTIKVAAAYAGANDSFVPEDVGALFKEPEPTVVFGDMCVRHHNWNSPMNNKRGKMLIRVAEESEFTVFGPTDPNRFYREEEVPFVVMAKNIPPALNVLPKRLKSDNNSVEFLCPLVMHLKSWRRPKIGKQLELPPALKELIREKNHLRRQWQVTKFSLIKEELNITKAALKIKLAEFRREAQKTCQVRHASIQI